MDQINRKDELMNRMDELTGGPQSSDYISQPTSGSSALENLKDAVAGKLHAAAGVIQEKAGQNPTAAGYAGQAANWLDDAAEYVREADSQKVKSDLQNQVRRNPGRSLLVAGAAGLLLGFLMRR